LDRFYQAARSYASQTIVRLTADCPCADPRLIDRVIELHFANGFDYTSNALEPTFPDGLDTEVFSFRTLERIWTEAKIPYQREHVTVYGYQHPELFKLGCLKSDISYEHLRVTLDTELDLVLLRAIYKKLFDPKKDFHYEDVIRLLVEDPELQAVNGHLVRNSSLLEQIKKEAQRA
jgi:spore coat polysaccharide biosynthesis protein SpsF